MPQLLFRGFKAEDICQISKPLVDELAEICDCGTDNFILECLHSTSIFDGKVIETFPFIEVKWFERGLETRDLFSASIAKYIQSLNIPEFEIAFSTFREDSYYVNGKRCFD